MKDYKIILKEKRYQKQQSINSIALNKALIKHMYDTEPFEKKYIDLNINKDNIKKYNRI